MYRQEFHTLSPFMHKFMKIIYTSEKVVKIVLFTYNAHYSTLGGREYYSDMLKAITKSDKFISLCGFHFKVFINKIKMSAAGLSVFLYNCITS